MRRPDHPQLDAIFSTVDEIRLGEERLSHLKARVATEAQALSQIADKQARIEAAIYAYWYAPEVNASDIAFGATGRTHPGRLIKMGGPVSLGVPCDRCTEDLPIRSRAQMKETLDRLRGPVRWPEGYRVLCLLCEEAIHEQRRTSSDQLHVEQQRRRRELAAMRYDEYLKTADWREIRDRYLWSRAYEHQDLACETCTSTEERGVYHKTTEGLGGQDDLVLLCSTCRDALLAAGRLTGPPGDGNRLANHHVVQLLAARRAELDG